MFSVENCGEEFIGELSKVLPLASKEEAATEDLIEVKMGCIQEVRDLVDHIFKKHYKCMWVDAACLVSPTGRKVLLCGRSGAGKSTTAAALVMGYGWSLLAEDVVLIDSRNRRNHYLCLTIQPKERGC